MKSLNLFPGYKKDHFFWTSPPINLNQCLAKVYMQIQPRYVCFFIIYFFLMYYIYYLLVSIGKYTTFFVQWLPPNPHSPSPPHTSIKTNFIFEASKVVFIFVHFSFGWINCKVLIVNSRILTLSVIRLKKRLYNFIQSLKHPIHAGILCSQYSFMIHTYMQSIGETPLWHYRNGVFV